MQSAPFPAEDLLRHRSWVRALARTLVRDDASADDLAQDAWLAAVENPPHRTDAPRVWLARVLRSRAVDAFRATSARGAREIASARPESVPSAAETVAQAETHRRVVDAVMELDEPYRTAVLLRFFEDLPPREVARRTGVPVETARTQVRRGVERLRAKLAPPQDERSRGALFVLAGLPQRGARPLVPLTSGGVWMALTAKKMAAVAALALVCALSVQVALGPQLPATRPGAVTASAVAEASPARASRASRESDPVAEPAMPPEPAPSRTRVRLRREDGGPLAGTEFAVLDGPRVEARGRLGEDATIDVAHSSRVRRLLVRPQGTAPQSAEIAAGARDAEIVLPAGAAVAGRVEIEGGLPWRGVRVWIQLESPVVPAAEVPAELGEPGAWTGTSFTSARVAKDGSFRVTGLPRGARGSAALPWGYTGPGGIGVDFTAPCENLVLSATRWPHVEGRIVRAGSEEPVAGAFVVVSGETKLGGWSSSTRSDDDGTFGIGVRGEMGTGVRLVVRDVADAPLVEVPLDGPIDAGRDLGDVVVPDPWASVARLEVVDRSGAPVKGAVAVFEEQSDWASAPSGADGRIEVPLGGAHRRVIVAAPGTGRATVDAGPAGDAPQRVVLPQGATVRVRFGPDGPPPGATVRLLARGRIVSDRPESWQANVLARGLGLTEPSARVREDDLGEFLWFGAVRGEDIVIGLLAPDAAFRIDAVDAAGAVLGASDVRVAAGESSEVVLAVPPLRPWRLRVEDSAGRPVAGAFVEFRDTAHAVLAPGDDEWRATGRTGADGRFAAAAVAARSLDVVVTAAGFVPRVQRGCAVATSGDAAEWIVRLEAGHRIVVRIRDRGAAAASADEVFVQPEGLDPMGPFGPVWEAGSSDDAEWTAEGVPAGAVEVVVRRGAHETRVRTTADAGTVEVVLDDGEK